MLLIKQLYIHWVPGSRSLCETILTDAMFELPGTAIKTLKITRNYCENKLKELR